MVTPVLIYMISSLDHKEGLFYDLILSCLIKLQHNVFYSIKTLCDVEAGHNFVVMHY